MNQESLKSKGDGDGISAEQAVLRLLAYCHGRDWAGHDPYDSLNSKLFQALPFLHSRWPRIILTQALKRSPVNVRPLLGIPETQNPKALALFLRSLLKLSRLGLLADHSLVDQLIERLVALRSPDKNYWSWGYSFPWQTRTIVVPRGASNLVCTTFVAEALLDAYERLKEQRLLEMASSAGDYLLEQLYYTEGETVASLSYPLPGLETKVHNANFLAAALLARLFDHTRDEKLPDPALKVARYSASRQKPDGSWDYGELPTQRWIDNFHTGFNLSALNALGKHLGTSEFEPHVRNGFQFYRNHFIREDGAPRYFHNRTYPIDIHCVAQTLLTLLEFRDLDPASDALARSVYDWAMKHMWDKDGFFYYRVLRAMTIRTSYMRWSQAWMLYALASLCEREARTAAAPSPARESASTTP